MRHLMTVVCRIVIVRMMGLLFKYLAIVVAMAMIFKFHSKFCVASLFGRCILVRQMRHCIADGRQHKPHYHSYCYGNPVRGSEG